MDDSSKQKKNWIRTVASFVLPWSLLLLQFSNKRTVVWFVLFLIRHSSNTRTRIHLQLYHILIDKNISFTCLNNHTSLTLFKFRSWKTTCRTQKTKTMLKNPIKIETKTKIQEKEQNKTKQSKTKRNEIKNEWKQRKKEHISFGEMLYGAALHCNLIMLAIIMRCAFVCRLQKTYYSRHIFSRKMCGMISCTVCVCMSECARCAYVQHACSMQVGSS